MSDQYDVVFHGQVLDGFNIETAKSGFASTFNIEPEKIDGFFSGEPHTLCKETDHKTAQQYKSTLESFGCVVELRDLKPKKINFDELTLVPLDASPTAEKVAPPPPPPAPIVDLSDKPIVCPKCKTEQPRSAECISCGIIFDKYFARIW